MDELIPKEVIYKILNEMGGLGVSLFQERVYTQRQVDGNPFPPLARSTIKTKKSRGGRVAYNAHKRMVATEDWVTNGYTYMVVDGELIFSFSEEMHGSGEATYKEISNYAIDGVGYDFFSGFSDSDVEVFESFLKIRISDFLGS